MRCSRAIPFIRSTCSWSPRSQVGPTVLCRLGPELMSVSIFLSYRRDDDAGYAGRLYDRLSALFPGAVFMDVPGIAPGEDFAAKIEQAVRSSSVLLVLIGKQWITAIDKQGRRRLDDPDDFVRREILAALAGGIRVVPVIVPGAENLKAEELPARRSRPWRASRRSSSAIPILIMMLTESRRF